MNKSFLKWAGGKSKLLPIILPELSGFKRLIEPFVGSGVVFLNCEQQEIIINDFNSDLINTYQQIVKNAPLVLTALEKLFKGRNTQQDFLILRSEFNNSTTSLFRKAVLFIYLNRHSFNGLCRYNGSGEFNVPYGKYDSPYFPEKEILQVSNSLKNTSLSILSGDFSIPLNMASANDVVYCDPPYVPINETSSFTSYSTGGFSLTQQKQLSKLAESAALRGAKILISNHDTETSRKLYQNASQIIELDVSRSISANKESRIKVKELIAIYK